MKRSTHGYAPVHTAPTVDLPPTSNLCGRGLGLREENLNNPALESDRSTFAPLAGHVTFLKQCTHASGNLKGLPDTACSSDVECQALLLLHQM